MAGRYHIPKKDLEFMAKDIRSELLPFLDPQEILKHLNTEARIQGRQLEERLQGLNPEEIKVLKQLLERLNTEKLRN